LTAAVDGDTVYFPPGTYIVDAAFTDIVQNVSILGDDATISASVRLTEPVFKWDARQDFTVSGINYDGEETYDSFSAPGQSLLTDIYGLIWLEACSSVTVSNIRGVECRNLIFLNSSSDCTVKDIYHIGVLNIAKADSNFHPTVVVRGVEGNKIYRVHAENGGDCVLGLNGTRQLLVHGCSGTNLFDNGVYISSGEHCVVSGCRFWDITGTDSGIKTRGSFMTVSGNTLDNVVNGIKMSSLDSAGVTSNNLIATGNSIDVYSSRGIAAVATATSDRPSNVVISNNSILGGTTAGPLGDAIHAGPLENLTITGNVIQTNIADYAILVFGASGTEAEKIVVSNNVISDATGEGIRFSDASRASAIGNVFESITGSAIRLLNTTDSIFVGNSYPEDGETLIRDASTTTNTGNVYAFNLGEITIDSAPALLNRVHSNYGTGVTSMTFAIDDATPNVEGGSFFLTGDDDALDITDFGNGVIGQVITIASGDAGNTTVKHDIAKINLVAGADWVSNTGASLKLWYDGTDWNEISRAAPTVA
jgi:hypothetical protein